VGGRRVGQDYWAFILCHSHGLRVRNVSSNNLRCDTIRYSTVTYRKPTERSWPGLYRGGKLDIKGDVRGGSHIAYRGRNPL